MLYHYGEHQTESDRKIIQAMSINTFRELLPDLRAAGVEQVYEKEY
jgi:hypothetical protein